MRATTSQAKASRRERSALRVSVVVSIVFAAGALVWGLAADSQAILLDAIFTPVGLLLTWGSLRVSRVVAEGPTKEYPVGRDGLVALFAGLQGLVLFGALAYAVAEAVRVILDGGSEVSAVTLILYGAVSGVVSIVTGLYLRRVGTDLTLVQAEAIAWLAGAVSSGVIVLGGTLVVLLRGTELRVVEPYTDSALVIVGSILLAALPLRLLRQAVRELQMAVPDSGLETRVRTAIESVRGSLGLPEPVVRISKTGNTVSVLVGFVLEAGVEAAVDEAGTGDRVRRALRAELDELPLGSWIIVEFTHDAELLE